MTQQWGEANQGIGSLDCSTIAVEEMKSSTFLWQSFGSLAVPNTQSLSGKPASPWGCPVKTGVMIDVEICIMGDVTNIQKKQNWSEDQFPQYPIGNMHCMRDGATEDNLHATIGWELRIETSVWASPLFLILRVPSKMRKPAVSRGLQSQHCVSFGAKFGGPVC